MEGLGLIRVPGNPATISVYLRGLRPVALRPALSSGLPFTGHRWEPIGEGGSIPILALIEGLLSMGM